MNRNTYHSRLFADIPEFDKVSELEKDKCEQHHKHRIRQWGTITNNLMRGLRNDNSITYQKLSSIINYWCSDVNIRKVQS